MNKCIDERMNVGVIACVLFFASFLKFTMFPLLPLGWRFDLNPHWSVWWDGIIAFESWFSELNSKLIYSNEFFIVCACLCIASKFKSLSFPCSLWHIVFIFLTFGSNFQLHLLVVNIHCLFICFYDAAVVPLTYVTCMLYA